MDAGDREHDFERLYRETRPGLWRALFAHTGGRGDVASDAVDEAFARALEHRAAIRSPVPWLYRTAFRLALEEVRRERRTTAGSPPDASDLAERGVEDVMAAMRRLSPNQRAAVFLFYVADLPVKEVADRLGMSPSTVRVHLHRGRRRLRELLGTDDVEVARDA
ncbi:MAG TPA: sigma-70 family RNA polymerase sigma factor [Actinomycetota bacterium]|nr:sigma-70 family RNA polymerase sigma factor [Actinomycetota bacterium]